MESKGLFLSGFQAAIVEGENITARIRLGEVFAERSAGYLNEDTLFVARFHAIPNIITEIKIDCKKV